jgi:hypothetical protein
MGAESQSSGGFVVDPFKIKLPGLYFLKKHPNPMIKVLAESGGIIMQVHNKWHYLPYTAITFPG